MFSHPKSNPSDWLHTKCESSFTLIVLNWVRCCRLKWILKSKRVHDLDPLKSYQQNPQFFSMLKLKNPAQHQFKLHLHTSSIDLFKDPTTVQNMIFSMAIGLGSWHMWSSLVVSCISMQDICGSFCGSTHFNVKYLMSNICDASFGFHLFQCKIYLVFWWFCSFQCKIYVKFFGGFIHFNAKYMWCFFLVSSISVQDICDVFWWFCSFQCKI